MKEKTLLLLLLVLSSSLIVKGVKQEDQLPLNPNVKKGVLPNGLTYYIQHNGVPVKQAEFYIVQKVGSMQEEESQRGLAHFLEHMAFNGTKNFPGNSLLTYLETIGVRFNENLNAYTSFDHTIYNISNVPIARSSTVDSLLLILHDWSGFITLDATEIDKERGVIREEWRNRNNGGQRVYESILKTVLKGDLISRRLPLGSMDIVEKFAYDDIRKYYKKWYRPDLQAIIIVGDVDVDDIEGRIKRVFSDIKKPENPAKRVYTRISDNKEPIVAIAADPEISQSRADVYYKKDIVPFSERNMAFFRYNTTVKVIISMLKQRFTEISRKPDSPFEIAEASFNMFFESINKNAWSTAAIVKNGENLNALKSIVRENERMHRFGFNQAELDLVKKSLQTNSESFFLEKNKQSNQSLIDLLIGHFLLNNAAVGVEFEYQWIKKYLSELTPQEVNSVAKSLVTEENMVVTLSMPQNGRVKIPTAADVLAVLKEVKAENITPYENRVITKPLLSVIPKPGRVIKEELSKFGYTKWTLANGAKVYLKKTKLLNDQILMRGISEGGTSLLELTDKPNYGIVNEVVYAGGFGEFDPGEMQKVLSSKIVSVQTDIETNKEQISGSASPKDFVTLMQLTYLMFTQPRRDEVAFQNTILNLRNKLENQKHLPESAFSDSISNALNNKHPFVERYNLDMLSRANYDRILAIYKERFANAADFSFIFTGNIDLDSVKNSIETYIGGLPSSSRLEKWKDTGVRLINGKKKIEVDRTSGAPKSTIFVSYSGKAVFNLRNVVLMEFVSSILESRYTEVIREKEGGAYGISVSGDVGTIPIEQFMIQITFETDPKLKEKMLALVYDEIKKLAEQGPTLVELTKVREFRLKKQEQQKFDNRFWQNSLAEFLFVNLDITDYENIVRSITPEMVKNVAQNWFGQNNSVEAVMSPKLTM